jgi:hypothetical protein
VKTAIGWQVDPVETSAGVNGIGKGREHPPDPEMRNWPSCATTTASDFPGMKFGAPGPGSRGIPAMVRRRERKPVDLIARIEVRGDGGTKIGRMHHGPHGVDAFDAEGNQIGLTFLTQFEARAAIVSRLSVGRHPGRWSPT